MKAQTEVHMMIRNVGEMNSEAKMFHFHGPLRGCLASLIQWVSNHGLLQRWDIAFARTKEECEKRLTMKPAKAMKAPTILTESDPDLEAAFQMLKAGLDNDNDEVSESEEV